MRKLILSRLLSNVHGSFFSLTRDMVTPEDVGDLSLVLEVESFGEEASIENMGRLPGTEWASIRSG